MPTYDYLCQECKKTSEFFHKMNESPTLTCPTCGSTALKKKPGAGIGLSLQGSGFYKNDYPSCSKSDGCCPCDKKA